MPPEHPIERPMPAEEEAWIFEALEQKRNDSLPEHRALHVLPNSTERPTQQLILRFARAAPCTRQ